MQIKNNQIFVPEFIQNLEPYRPGKSIDLEHYNKYKAIICSNENNLGPSPLAMSAIKNEVSKIHFYPDPQGEKLVEKLAKIHQRNANEIILSNGLDGLLYTVFKAFSLPGDNVISSEFSFVAFNKFSKMNNVELRLTPMTREYKFDLQEILKSIDDRTRIIYICNPNNPTGTSINETTLKDFLNKVPKSILVILDEAYYEFGKNADSNFPDTIQMKYNNVISLRTLSKIYGLAGLRIGYGIADEYIISALKKVKLVFNPNSLAQVGALAALDDFEHLKKTLDNNKYWISEISIALKQKGIFYIESYANFITVIFPSIEEASSFNSFMDSAGVLLRKLDGFGMPNAIRISIGNSDEMKFFLMVLTTCPIYL